MRRLILIISLAIGLAFFVYPSSFLATSSTLPDDNDTRLISYIIGQVQDNLLHFRNPYIGRFFAPYENTLAYSDLFLTTSLITLPIQLFTKSPINIFNFSLIIDFVLTFTTCFFLIRFLTKDDFSALIATILFNLSGVHLAYLPHLQIFSLWLFFGAIYCFLRRQKSVFLNLFFLFLTAQIADSIFVAYLIIITATLIYLFDPKGTKQFVHRLPIYLPLWLLLVFPYLKLVHTFPEAARPIRDAAHFSLGLEEIFTKFNSWILILIFSSALFLNIRQSLHRYYFVLLTALILTLGPVLKIHGTNVRFFGFPIPLPYTLFYYLLPGFKGFRTPSRFIILAAFFAVVIIAHKLAPLAKKFLPQTKFFILSLIILSLALEGRFPRQSFAVDIKLPTVYQSVKSLPDNSIILELPIKLWNAPNHEIESVRSLYSLSHGHRRVNGFSGFAPLVWIDLVEQINQFGLSPENLNRLHALGVTHVVEENQLYPLP